MNSHAKTLKNITKSLFNLSAIAFVSLSMSTAIADETCLSPYMARRQRCRLRLVHRRDALGRLGIPSGSGPLGTGGSGR